MVIRFMQHTKASKFPASSKSSKVKAGFHVSNTGSAVIVRKYEPCGAVLHSFNFIR